MPVVVNEQEAVDILLRWYEEQTSLGVIISRSEMLIIQFKSRIGLIKDGTFRLSDGKTEIVLNTRRAKRLQYCEPLLEIKKGCSARIELWYEHGEFAHIWEETL